MQPIKGITPIGTPETSDCECPICELYRDLVSVLLSGDGSALINQVSGMLKDVAVDVAEEINKNQESMAINTALAVMQAFDRLATNYEIEGSSWTYLRYAIFSNLAACVPQHVAYVFMATYVSAVTRIKLREALGCLDELRTELPFHMVNGSKLRGVEAYQKYFTPLREQIVDALNHKGQRGVTMTMEVSPEWPPLGEAPTLSPEGPEEATTVGASTAVVTDFDFETLPESATLVDGNGTLN